MINNLQIVILLPINSSIQYFKILRKPRILENNKVDTKGNKIAKVKSIGPGVVMESVNTNSLSGTPLARLSSQQITSVRVAEEQKGTSGVYVSTKDAYTLTDGPTIFLTNEVEKIAKFYIQQSNIPSNVMNDILEKININNVINDKITILEQELELLTEKNNSSNEDADNGKSKKKDTKVKLASDENTDGRNISRLENEIERFRNMIQSAQLNETFVPNKALHLKKWVPSLKKCNPYTSDIDEQTIIEIMMLKDVDDSWKVLLLMGIGVFTNHPSIAYTEIIKKLANLQKDFLK